ncbi:GNAT family N-acetyltransferase [Gracilimonas amylolytica]|uniref:GNAT family N-acetyltransferase n=1 Tax=Gracilimonas amylolytica TaxID=1749045 RepID=UPI000CD8446A|nr:GNAT family N-acetyltransferase [Gracilimonas amylolytica]
MNTVIKSYKDLLNHELEDLFRLRQQVFIIEQECFYEDIDGYDEKAEHLLIYDQDILAAYLRIFKPGLKYNEASLGRIVVAPKYRGTGLGEKLIRKGIELCEGGSVRIEAQSALLQYYNNLGFQEEGEIYPVDGIDHIQMVLP